MWTEDPKFYSIWSGAFYWYTLLWNSNITDFHLVRLVENCRWDFRHWDARFDTKTNRPYLEGHEHPDVTVNRHQFIHYPLTNIDSYYTVTAEENPRQEITTAQAWTILICRTNNFQSISAVIFFDILCQATINPPFGEGKLGPSVD